MKIIDLTEEHEGLFFQCLEDWSDEIKEGGDHKACWYGKMKDKGLGVKLGMDEKGVVGGMIQYIPIAFSPAEGEDLYFAPCIWVHGYKKGRGNFQKKGMGRALLRAAEEDVKNRGAKGLAVWGVSMPSWMKASWFKKQGYKPVDNVKGAVLLWKPFAADAAPPRWARRKRTPVREEGKVIVTAFYNGCCPAQNLILERARRASKEIGGKVEFRDICTFDRDVFRAWGIADGLFLDDREVRTGPPPPYNKILKKIGKAARKIK